jgi:16S rRNA (uracil1498-N3)-methyltransferase
MKHQPHLWIEVPWAEHELGVSEEASRHLTRVLRFRGGERVSYTDGVGSIGTGVWDGSAIERGEEFKVERPRTLITLAVAAPKSKDRQRSIVEKAQELGVARLVWLRTEYGQGRPASDAKMSAWALGSLEQSRGSWLLELDRDAVLSEFPGAIVLDAGGTEALSTLAIGSTVTLAIGPEGGFSTHELESAAVTASIPANILRTDTAAIVAVATVLNQQ